MTSITTIPFHIKSLTDEGFFAGYASVFGIRDAQGDMVQPGAFRATLAAMRAAGRYPALLWQHQPGTPIGVIEHLEEDHHGLKMQARLLLEVRQAREAHALLKGGALDGLSIGYEVVQAQTDRTTGTRLLEELRLWEISLVTFPANAAARVTAVKSDPWGQVLEALRKAAAILRPAPVPAVFA